MKTPLWSIGHVKHMLSYGSVKYWSGITQKIEVWYKNRYPEQYHTDGYRIIQRFDYDHYRTVVEARELPTVVLRMETYEIGRGHPKEE